MKNQKTVLITGAAGYIGSAVVRLLCDHNYKVIALDNLEKGEKKYIDKRSIFSKVCLKDFNKLEKIFLQYKPTCIIHLAAKKSVSESEICPISYYDNNVKASINLISLANKYDVKKIVFASTAAVYAQTQNSLYNEDSKIFPSSVYGNTKFIIEEFLHKAEQTSSFKSVVLRFFNVVGDFGLSYKEKEAQNIFPKVAEAIKLNKPVNVFGKNWETLDGTGVRDYIHLHDLCAAVLLSVQKDVHGIFNLGTNKGTSVLQIIKLFENELKKKVKFVYKKPRKGDVAVSLADSSKAYTKLSWKPVKSVKHAVIDAVRVYELE